MVHLFQHQKHTCVTGMLLMFCCIIFKETNAQNNLVPNSSFEQYTICPVGTIDDKPDYWYKPDKRGAGYLNSCAGDSGTNTVPYHFTLGGTGFQYPHLGNAYVGMFYRNGGNRRNYFQVQLNDSLLAGKCYYAECYVNASNRFEIGCNNQSILLTNDPIYADTLNGIKIILANPQITNYNNPIIIDTLNWIKVSGVFTSQGGEQYLTIGNFRDDNNTPYIRFQTPGSGYDGAAYYVDDVSVYALDSFPLKADAGLDTTIALGDSVFIGSLTNGIPNITWYNMAGNVIDTGRPGFFVHPTTTTSYIIEQTVCGYYSRDTVTVTVNVMPLHWLGLSLTPGPSPTPLERGDVLLRWQTANEFNVSHFNIQRSYRGTNEFENVGQVKANNKPYNQYTYLDEPPRNEKQETVLYRIQSIDKDGQRSYSPIRRINMNHSKVNMIIYPNPAKDHFIVESNNANTINVLNWIGQSVLQLYHISNKQTISTKGFPKGLYSVQCIQKNGGVLTGRVVVD